MHVNNLNVDKTDVYSVHLPVEGISKVSLRNSVYIIGHR